jgi:putative transposase
LKSYERPTDLTGPGSVLEDVIEWQNRPLDPMYAVVFFDALRVRIRDEGTVKNKAVYLALGIQRDGTKEVLGIWIQQSEGAKFWLGIMNELNHRGLKDILVAVIDGLKGFPEAISAVYPDSEIQTCIVHLIRNSLNAGAEYGTKSSPFSLTPTKSER